MERSTENAQLAEIRRRLGDYDSINFTEQRDKLVEAWRKHHAEAAKEASAYLHPLILHHRFDTRDPAKHPDEIWINDVYQVSVRRWDKDPVFGTRGGMVQLGINTHDGTARHDWREFQAIKNQFAGDECEAFELYPAESRLLDPSSYYSLWCFPGLKRIRVGINEGREARDADEALAPQRAFPQRPAAMPAVGIDALPAAGNPDSPARDGNQPTFQRSNK